MLWEGGQLQASEWALARKWIPLAPDLGLPFRPVRNKYLPFKNTQCMVFCYAATLSPLLPPQALIAVFLWLFLWCFCLSHLFFNVTFRLPYVLGFCEWTVWVLFLWPRLILSSGVQKCSQLWPLDLVYTELHTVLLRVCYPQFGMTLLNSW